MVLIKEIELALKPRDTEARAQEDEVLADSVLELADADFSKVEEFEEVAPGTIRKHVEADMRTAYPGKPTSRNRVFKGLSKSKIKTAVVSDETPSDSDDNNEPLGGTSDEEASDESNDLQSSNESYLDDEDVRGSDSNDYDGSILGNEDKSEGSETANEEARENSIEVFSRQTRDFQGDIDKGKSISNQLALWERLIESRIKLQPSLINSNRLYQHNTFMDFKSSLSSDEEEIIMETYEVLSNLMKTLLDLQENLLDSVPSYQEIKSQKKKLLKRKTERKEGTDEAKKMKAGDLLGEIHEDFQPFRNSTIEKWNEKTRITSGKLKKNDFSAFDLPTLKQIEEILVDRERLLRRTRTKRSDYPILGKNEEGVVEAPRKKNLNECDSEIFDDDDFYHKLLRDFIEKKTSDVSDASKKGKQWLELQKLRSKMKSKVDTRASKGRKLRFTVHNKMVNFMAAVPTHAWTEDAKNELFKSLFK